MSASCRIYWMDRILYGMPLSPAKHEAACCTEAGLASLKDNQPSPCVHACTAIT